jgi:hypothetical protein
MWGLMAQGCAGNGANVVEEMVTRRPWACGVVTVTDADTSTTTKTGQKAQESGKIKKKSCKHFQPKSSPKRTGSGNRLTYATQTYIMHKTGHKFLFILLPQNFAA